MMMMMMRSLSLNWLANIWNAFREAHFNRRLDTQIAFKTNIQKRKIVLRISFFGIGLYVRKSIMVKRSEAMRAKNKSIES